MIKVSLIGVSGYASLYLKNLERLHGEGRLSLVAALVHEPHQHAKEIERLQNLGAAIFETAEAFFSHKKGQVDLCCIPTGIPSHGALSCRALETGCNVLVEKPAAASVEEIDQIQATALKEGKKVFVGYQNMYSHEVWDIKEALLAGAIGKVQGLYCMGLWPRSSDYFKRNSWAGRVVLDGQWIYDSVLHNAFGHFLNLLCFWSGTERNASAKIEQVEAKMYRVLPIESFDTCSVRLVTEAGTEMVMTVSHNSKTTVDPVIRIQGTKGSIEWTPEHYTINGLTQPTVPGVDASFNKARSTMFDHVVATLNGKEVPVCDLSIARVPTLVVNTMHRDFEINSIDPGLVEAFENDLGPHKAIKGIEEAVQKAFDQGHLLRPLVLEVT